MKKNKRSGYTLVELVSVMAILAILIMMIMPNAAKLTQAAERTATETEAVEVANAVRRYIRDKMDEGKFDRYVVWKLINLELDNPDNVLRDYISGGMEGGRIEAIYVELDTGVLGNLTYVNQFDRVRISYDNEGRQTVEHVDSGI